MNPPRLFDKLPETTKKFLQQEQTDLEMKSVDDGVARYRRMRESQDHTAMTPEQDLLVSVLPHLIAGIEKTKRAAASGRALRGVHIWGMRLCSLPSDKLAIITLSTAINGVLNPEKSTYAAISRAIGAAVKAEREFSVLKKSAPDILQEWLRHTKRLDLKEWKRTGRAAYQRAKVAEMDGPWDQKTTTWVGSILLTTLIQFSDIIEHEMVMHKGRTVGRLKMRADLLDRLEKQHATFEVLRPVFYPMVVPPVRWADSDQGGYLHHRVPLMKRGRGNTDGTVPAAPLVRESIDLMGRTGWRVNEFIFRVADTIHKAGGGTGGIPTRENKPLPARPADIDSNPVALSEWKLEAAKVYGFNAEQVIRRGDVIRVLDIIRSMRGKSMFFPHQLDWRSRAYPVPAHVGPQAADLGRAIIEFDEGKPLGPSGMFWLTNHLANMLGVKGSFATRASEVLKRMTSSGPDSLSAWVDDPIRNTGWGDTEKYDDPFLLLAAAREYVNAKRSGDPTAYVSHLCVSLDGSCNGLQHLSAMGLDEIGGRAVNLIPSPEPQDIYSDVSAVVEIRVRADATANPSPDNPATQWVGRITRSTVKRSVMTTPYGVTQAGIRTQFIMDGHTDGMNGKFACAQYLKDVTYNAVGQVVIAARNIMDWLQSVAKQTAPINHGLSWITPAGFTVHQEYLITTTTVVRTLTQSITLRVPHRERIIDEAEQVRGTAPNFVHSFDAAHMHRTTVAAANRGVTHFGMVHDSFGTHAADMDTLRSVLREEFVAMYSEKDWLAEFKTSVEQATGLTLPDLPAKGHLNLQDVLRSPYVFN